MPARRVCPALLLLLLAIAPRAGADERDRFHAWVLGGPAFLLQPGDDAKGAIPQVQAGVALAATPRVDVSFDVRRLEVELRPPTTPYGEGLRRSILAWGPGIRRTIGDRVARPFLQANVLLITEHLDDDAVIQESGIAVGLGLLAGADIRVTEAFSIPIAANVLLGQAITDVSSVGLVAGLALHPSTGWSADPATRALEAAAARTAKREVEVPPRSRVELAGGTSATQDFGGAEGTGAFRLARATYLRSVKPGLGIAFDGRLYRRTYGTGTSTFYFTPDAKSTQSIVLVGPGARFTRKAGILRGYFQGNAWLASDTRTSEDSGWESSRRSLVPALGFALGLDVRLSPRVTMPLALRYDQLIQTDDYALASLEGGLGYSWGR